MRGRGAQMAGAGCALHLTWCSQNHQEKRERSRAAVPSTGTKLLLSSGQPRPAAQGSSPPCPTADTRRHSPSTHAELCRATSQDSCCSLSPGRLCTALPLQDRDASEAAQCVSSRAGGAVLACLFCCMLFSMTLCFQKHLIAFSVLLLFSPLW